MDSGRITVSVSIRVILQARDFSNHYIVLLYVGMQGRRTIVLDSMVRGRLESARILAPRLGELLFFA